MKDNKLPDTSTSDDKTPIARRNFLLGAGTAVAAGLAPTAPAQAQTPQPAVAASPAIGSEPLLTLTATEHAFFAAAADTIIPADELSPSGSDCGVATFIDRQLAGAYGSGARLYRDGPFPKGKPELGYQLPLSLLPEVGPDIPRRVYAPYPGHRLLEVRFGQRLPLEELFDQVIGDPCMAGSGDGAGVVVQLGLVLELHHVDYGLLHSLADGRRATAEA